MVGEAPFSLRRKHKVVNTAIGASRARDARERMIAPNGSHAFREEAHMAMSRLVSMSAFALGAALMGCSSGNHDMSTHMMTADYQSSGTYMHDSSAGQVMTTPDGMTVYTYDKYSAGASSCYGECAEHWPPVTASAGAQPYGNMTIIPRSDGTRQWAYNGMPLYTYDDDEAPGDIEGDNENGVWHVVK
jgi:predicted lipoprotein with Yx(FWY)xxD motif